VTTLEIAMRLESGMTHVNDPTIGGEAHMLFGGIKATGVGPRGRATCTEG
jgi:acyl-CoA reductase-like NAD-dependent aldehyde dehydrogenase